MRRKRQPAVAACRPVVWTERYQLPGTEETPVYPGSIIAQCVDCGVDVYVGPRAQALDVPHVICCFICTGRRAKPGEVTRLRSLGNPYLPGGEEQP